MNSHIDSITKKVNGTKAFLQRNTSCCPRKIKVNCYTTFVRPSQEYASSVWSPHTQKNIIKLESVQRRSARYVMNDFSHNSSVTAMMHHLEWQTLEIRRHDMVDLSSNPYLTHAPLTTRRDSSSQEHESRAISTPSSQPQQQPGTSFRIQRSVTLHLRPSGTA